MADLCRVYLAQSIVAPPLTMYDDDWSPRKPAWVGRRMNNGEGFFLYSTILYGV